MGMHRLLLLACALICLIACEPAAGDGDPEALLLPQEAAVAFQSAVSAIDEENWEVAEAKSEEGAALGGAMSYPLRHFLHGMVAYSRGEKAKALAGQVEAGLPEWDLAIRQFEHALRHFAEAATGMPDGAAARRNAERAWLALESSRKGRAEAEAKKKQADTNPQPEPPAGEDPKAPGTESLSTEDDPNAAVTEELLLSRDLAQVWEKLKEKELEKREVRRQFQTRNAQPGVRDW